MTTCLKYSSKLFEGIVRSKKLCAKRSFQTSLSKRKISQNAVPKIDVPENRLEFVDLRNGMRLISECKDSSITTVGFLVPAGSMHEQPEERGASLFLEHLIFRRTRCRSREEIAEILDKTCGKFGAIAMRDMFLFYGSAPSYNLEPVVELLADIIINGVTSNDDVIAASRSILRELAEMETSNPEKVVMDYLPTIAYQGTALGNSVYPSTSVVRNMKMNTIENFRRRLFQPNSMTMICTGGTSFEDIQNLASEYFLGSGQDRCPIEDDECAVKNSDCTPHFRFTGSEMRFRDDHEPLGYVAIAVEGPGYANCRDHCNLTVAKHFVGSWDLSDSGGKNNSPYLAQCAFNTDMCQIYKSFDISWANTSLWGCYFCCEKMKLEDMTWMVQNEWMRLCSSITSKEVTRAVNQTITREILRLNDSIDRFHDIANYLQRRGCYDSLNNRIARYQSVTADSVREVAWKYIYDQCPALAAYGSIDNLPDYNFIRSYMYRLRH